MTKGQVWRWLRYPHLGSCGAKVDIHLGATIANPGRVHLGEGCRIYKGAVLNVRENPSSMISLGREVKVHEYSLLDTYGGSIEMDDFSGVGHHCVLGGHGRLKVGKHSMISGLTYIVPANHNFADPSRPYREQGETMKGIVIGENVWIGASCVILDGVTIGDNSVVGAGSVVTRSVPPMTLSVGVPARVVKRFTGSRWASAI